MFPITRRAERALLREGNPVALLRNEVDSLMNRFLGDWMVPEEFFPAVPTWDWEETEKEFVLRAPMAGFAPEEIDVRMLGNELTVRAEHREGVKGKKPENGHGERFGRVERRMTLPEGVNAEKVEAHYRNGMLEVHFPRLPGAAARRIEVKT